MVTGGTTGLGREIALGFAAAGADVVASSRAKEQVDAVAAEIEALGRRTLRVACDVLDRASIQRLHDAVIAAFGKVDILVNAAGMAKKAPTLDEDEAEWLKIIDTNLTGTMRACQIFGRTMVSAHYGRIINVASSTAFRGSYQLAAYGASKSAVASLTKTLAIELAESGVNVNAIAPGVFPTEMSAPMVKDTPRGEEIADAHADASLWQAAGSGGPGDFSGVGGSGICDWRSACRGRRLSGERSERVKVGTMGPREDQGNKGASEHAIDGRSAGTGEAMTEGRKLRMGMVGGGPGAFIGPVHRIAAETGWKDRAGCGSVLAVGGALTRSGSEVSH